MAIRAPSHGGSLTRKMMRALVCLLGLTISLSIYSINFNNNDDDDLLLSDDDQTDVLFLEQNNNNSNTSIYNSEDIDDDTDSNSINDNDNNNNNNNNNNKSRNLVFDFYRNECGDAEKMVWGAVDRLVNGDVRISAQLLRLLFHDCFIQGCDASVLMAATHNDSTVERQAIPNQTLKGFDLIDSIKQELEKVCPGVVSCADIIVLTARAGIAQTSGPFYPVLTGRLDSTGSFFYQAMADIPKPNGNISETLRLFGLRGFNAREVVALLGAHNIGKIGCDFIEPRLSRNFMGTGHRDPTISPETARELSGRCIASRRNGGGGDISAGPGTMDSHYYRNLITGKGLLFADNQLMFDTITAEVVREYASDTFSFRRDFARAMVKLSSLTGTSQGEVRRNCSRPNA